MVLVSQKPRGWRLLGLLVLIAAALLVGGNWLDQRDDSSQVSEPLPDVVLLYQPCQRPDGLPVIPPCIIGGPFAWKDYDPPRPRVTHEVCFDVAASRAQNDVLIRCTDGYETPRFGPR